MEVDGDTKADMNVDGDTKADMNVDGDTKAEMNVNGDTKADMNAVPEELMEGCVDISADQNGGVKKVILREGTGDESPGIGDDVVVHYTGTLANGEKFDSSRDRKDKFKFKLGQGQVIKAWDEGVASMKRGELCRLICRSDYAYGDAGSPPKIPGGATLLFEVELFDWKGEDLSEEVNGGLLRTIKVKGPGFVTPNDGAVVKVNVKGTHEGRVFDERTVEFTVGDAVEQGLPDGLDIAIKKFKKGETSVITMSSQYGFGFEGYPEYNIPANATIKYEVTLVELEKAKEGWEMEPDQKIAQSELCKTKGTNFFKASQYAKAINKYKLVIKWLDDDMEFSDQQKSQRTALRLAAHLNCALCYIKQQQWPEAKKQCDEAMEFDANNEKAFFRRGQAYMGTKDWNEAKADFQHVLKIDPQNKTAKNQLTITEHHLKQEREREKKLYANMFSKMSSPSGDGQVTEQKAEEEKADATAV